jgi:hypothetical protein
MANHRITSAEEGAQLLLASLLMSQRLAPTAELRPELPENDIPDDMNLGLSAEGYIQWAALVLRRDQLLADVEQFAGEVG